MLKILFSLNLSWSLIMAQGVDFTWPYYLNTGWPVEEINSNLGDYRNINRFHLGIDVQQRPSTQVFPITISQLETDPIYNAADTQYTFILQHGTYDQNTGFTPILNSYSVYTHLRNINTSLHQGSVVYTATHLSLGHDLFGNHLHFNFVTNLNSTFTNINDDAVQNPLELGWVDFRNSDNTPPLFHNLYAEVTNGTMEVLNFPGDYTDRFFANDPEDNYYRISYGDPMPADIPRVLIRNIASGCQLRFILQATDTWNDSGLTPHIIKVYLDQNEEPPGDPTYFSVEFSEIQEGRPNAEIVYNTEAPLATAWGTLQQYYRLYRHTNNAAIIPNQIVHNALYIDTGTNGEEGMHRVEIILESEPPYIGLPQRTVGALYYYLLHNNNSGDDSYLDLSQSTPNQP